MIELKDEDLLLRLKNFEDNFIERKTSGDSKDWLKTVVAFANSTPIGYPAVLYVGVKNDGTPEEKTVNLDSLQLSFGHKVADAYPPIYYLTKILNVGGKQILAVVVPGSELRPHFAGPSFVREGSQSVTASKEQFERLIASRNSKAYEILKWRDKEISLEFMEEHKHKEGVVADCNQFFCMVKFSNSIQSYPLRRVDIASDNDKRRLRLEVRRA